MDGPDKQSDIMAQSSDFEGVRKRGVVVNFDSGERFPRPRSQQRGSLRPRARREAVLGVGAGGGRLGVPHPEVF